MSTMPVPPSLDDEAAIRLARSTQTRAIASGDLDLVAQYWTDDITIRRGLGHPVDGIAAARDMLDAGAGAGKLVYQREAVTVEVSTAWPLAYEEGRWAGYTGDVSDAPVVKGRYAAQWVKRDGRWLIRSEVFVALDATGDGRGAVALP
jgi:ketosteroid isomerase-like protein